MRSKSIDPSELRYITPTELGYFMPTQQGHIIFILQPLPSRLGINDRLTTVHRNLWDLET